jgi:glycosyltransferase involved in cell wall biosynthesis
VLPLPGVAPTPGPPQFISVAIPTRNRPAELSQCLASLEKVEYYDWELIIVDQSSDDTTADLCARWSHRLPRVVYLRLSVPNASAARNTAIQAAGGDILAFVDDDCTVGSDWLKHVAAAFEKNPGSRLVFGSVVAGQHDPATAFVPKAEIQTTKVLRGALDTLRFRGIGAGMYVRLDSAETMVFDPLLGPGARFRASQDEDYAFRHLAAGDTLVQTPYVSVVHHGARRFAGGVASAKLKDYLYGAGACHVKLIRCGQVMILFVIVRNFTRLVGALRPWNALLGRPTHLARALAYGRGLWEGARTPIDKHRRLFIDDEQASASITAMAYDTQPDLAASR